MWIGSLPHLIDRRRLVSPLGYQSPALGDSVPAPGLQDTQRVTLQLGVTTSTLSRVPQLFASAVSQARTHQEVESEPRISQWWGHRGLHQDEVSECLTAEETRPVSSTNSNGQLTIVPRPSTLPDHLGSQDNGTTYDDLTKPLLARALAASEGNDLVDEPHRLSLARAPAAFEGDDTDDNSSSSTTLVSSPQATSRSSDSQQPTRALSTTLTRSSLPLHERYAQHLCSILDYTVKEEPPPAGTSSLGKRTLTPGNTQPCVYPDCQLTLFKLGACQQNSSSCSIMSSTTPSVGDENHRNKTRNTNNSAS